MGNGIGGRAKSEKLRKRRLLLGLVAFVSTVAFGSAGFRVYPRLNEERLLKRARSAIAVGDLRSGYFSAARALQVNPQSVAAVTLLVNLAERQGDPGLLSWKRRLVEIQPVAVENRISLAETALALGQPNLANEALRPTAATAPVNSKYHHLAGRVARALEDFPKAEAEFAVASKLQPENLQFAFDLATQRLDSGNLETHAAGKHTLEQLMERNPEIFAQCCRTLIREAISAGDANRSLLMARRLQNSHDASFLDRIILLDLLHRTKSAEYTSFLTQLQEISAADPEDVFALLSWMNANGAAMSAIDWSRSLSPALRSTLQVRVAMAESLAVLRDWDKLNDFVTVPSKGPSPATHTPAKSSTLRGSPWGPYEFERLAFSAAILRARGDRNYSHTVWELAVREAGNRPDAHLTLAGYVAEWGWEEETDALWRVAMGTIEPDWALKVLYQQYDRARSAAGMYKVMTRSTELHPNDLSAKNNRAFLGILLGTDLEKETNLARETYEAKPDDPNFRTTYGLGLLMQSHGKKAVELMRSLPEEQLEAPQIAVYYGIFLANEGSWELAGRFLQLGKNAKLLPEEKRLVERAEAQVNWSSQAKTADKISPAAKP